MKIPWAKCLSFVFLSHSLSLTLSLSLALPLRLPSSLPVVFLVIQGWLVNFLEVGVWLPLRVGWVWVELYLCLFSCLPYFDAEVQSPESPQLATIWACDQSTRIKIKEQNKLLILKPNNIYMCAYMYIHIHVMTETRSCADSGWGVPLLYSTSRLNFSTSTCRPIHHLIHVYVTLPLVYWATCTCAYTYSGIFSMQVHMYMYCPPLPLLLQCLQ